MISTNRNTEETDKEITERLEDSFKNRYDQHFDFSNYARQVITKLTNDRFKTLREFEAELQKKPIEIEIDAPGLEKVEVVYSKGFNGTYTVFLNPFYTKEDMAPKNAFLDYLRDVDQTLEAVNEEFNLNSASMYAKGKIVYGANRRRIKVDDIAYFTLKKGASAQFSETELHSVAFLCLEKKKQADVDIVKLE
jgi:hypothetical protein